MTIIWNYFKSICTCVPPISFIHPKWTKAWQAIVPALMYVSMLATSWPFGARHAIDVNLECWHCVQITLCRYQAGLTPPTLVCWEGFCFVCAKVEGVFGFCLVGSMGGKGGIMQKDHSCWFVWVVIYINLYIWWNIISRKLQHALRAHENHSPSKLWKESLNSLLVKGLGVCSKGVLFQPQWSYGTKLIAWRCWKNASRKNPWFSPALLENPVFFWVHMRIWHPVWLLLQTSSDLCSLWERIAAVI